MPRPFKSKSLRDRVGSQFGDLAAQTDELRQQVVDRAPGVRDQIVEQTGDLRQQIVDRAPGVRDQIVEQTGDLRQQIVDRAPGVRDQIVAALPDKGQLLDLRDDLFDRLPENVQDRLPERVKPKRKRLRKVAAIGVLVGAGGAAFAILKRKGSTPEPYVAPKPYVAPVPPSPAPPAPTASSFAEPEVGLDDIAGTGDGVSSPK